MRNMSMLLSTLVLAAMVLAACGGGATSTNVVESPPPVTAETEVMPATEMPTDVGTATEEPGVPVTGDINPARLSNELEFMVVDQTGSQVGEVEDMVLDLTNRNVAYVIVNADGRSVAVPWTSLTLQTGDTAAGGAMSTPSGDATAVPEATGEATEEAMEGTATTEPGTATSEATAEAGAGVGIAGGQQGVFVIQDATLLTSAPEFDMTALPEVGLSADDWDADIRSFWESGGAAGGTGATSTPSGDATAVPDATEAATEAVTATATEAATEAATQAVAEPQTLQGVMLASELLGSTLMLGTGTGAAQATMEPGEAATTVPGTATEAPGATAEATAEAGTGTDMSNMTVTIEDAIVDTTAGNILYLVVSTTLAEGERWIPVPLGMFQWDGMGFVLDDDGTMLQSAPSFTGDQFPDTTMSGWNSEFDTFWQSGGVGGGAGSAGEATATP